MALVPNWHVRRYCVDLTQSASTHIISVGRGLAAVLAALCLMVTAEAETLGAWSLSIPKNAAVSGPTDGAYEIREGTGATYTLSAPLPANGKRPVQYADQFAAGFAAMKPDFKPDVIATSAGGGDTLIRMGSLTDPQSGEVSVLAIVVFKSGDNIGLFIADIHDQGALDRVGDLMGTVAFNPKAASAITTAKSATPPPRGVTASTSTASGSKATAALAVVWPKGGVVATTRPGVSVPQAIAMSIDPNKTLMPDSFDCYADESDTEEVAAADPLGRVTFARNGTYTWSGPGAGSGNWSHVRSNASKPPLSLSGPLGGLGSDDTAYFHLDRHGQRVGLSHTASGKALQCYQQGPAAENFRLSLARKIIAPGAMRCELAKGGTLDVVFNGRGYASPQGNGTFEVGVKGARDSSTVHNWFTGGPFDSARGDYREDEEGFRILELAIHYTNRRAFSVSASTEPVAVCAGQVTPRPFALFGAGAAPKSSGAGGLDGLYSKLESYMDANGIILFNFSVHRFQPNGWFTTIDDEASAATDCARTLPSGAPMCRAYEVSGNRIRMQEEDESGPGEWVSFSRTSDGFDADEESFSRVAPLTGFKLNATYALDRATSFGGIGQPAGMVLRWSQKYVFTSAGRFVFEGASSSNTYLNGGSIGGGGAIGGGGSSRSSSGAGTYSVSGNAMTLKFDDGRTQRVTVHNLGDGWKAGAAGPEFLWIDGEQLERQ
jgi:hypothetical protein